MHKILVRGIAQVRGLWMHGAALLLGLGLILGAPACRIGTSECSGGNVTPGTGEGGSGGEGGSTSTGVGAREIDGGGTGGGGENLCAHFGETCVDTDGGTGVIGPLNATACVCCTGCFGQTEGRCESGLLNFACGGGGQVCTSCSANKGCGQDQLCHTLCVDPDTGILLPNGTACVDDGNGAGHCFGGICQLP